MKSAPLILLAMLLLTGCNGIPVQMGASDRFMHHSRIVTPALAQATATQWNEEYAVSVGHTPFMQGVERSCTTACDLVFIRRSAMHGTPTWRQAQSGERVVAVGYHPLTLQAVMGEGVALAPRLSLPGRGAGVAYGLHSGPVIKGMSGGPVYAESGEVLGITVGYVDQQHQALPAGFEGVSRLSVYLPFEVIQQEWLKFRAEESRDSEYRARFRKPLIRQIPTKNQLPKDLGDF